MHMSVFHVPDKRYVQSHDTKNLIFIFYYYNNRVARKRTQLSLQCQTIYYLLDIRSIPTYLFNFHYHLVSIFNTLWVKVSLSKTKNQGLFHNTSYSLTYIRKANTIHNYEDTIKTDECKKYSKIERIERERERENKLKHICMQYVPRIISTTVHFN